MGVVHPSAAPVVVWRSQPNPVPGEQPPEISQLADAIAYTLIETAKLNAVDPHAWLADTLARIPDYKITKVDDLLPWRWNR